MPQSYLLIGAGALILLVLALTFAYLRRGRRELPYLADDFLFSPEQLAFKRVLDAAVGDAHEVYGQIRVADVIGVRAGVSRRQFDRAYARVGERCFDFLICERRTSAILCAVNLVRRTRTTGPLPKDDLDAVCQAAQLPFLRVPEDDDYDREAIRAALGDALRPAPSRPERRAPARERIDDSEELELLRGLSQSIVGEGMEELPPPARPEPRPTPGGVTRPAVRPSLVKADGQDAHHLQRPSQARGRHDHDDNDEGPAFRIDGDLSGEQPDRGIRRLSVRR